MSASQHQETQTVVMSMTTQTHDIDSVDEDSANQDNMSTPTKPDVSDDDQSLIDGDDNSDSTSDFTQRSKARREETSIRLKSEVAKLNRVKAETYFMAAVDAKENREKYARKLEAKKWFNQPVLSSLQKSPSVLFHLQPHLQLRLLQGCPMLRRVISVLKLSTAIIVFMLLLITLMK